MDERFTLEIEVIESNFLFTIKHLDGYSHDYVIDWGDGNINQILNYSDNNLNHTYVNNGIYTINISGICETINFVENYDESNPSSLAVKKVKNWGKVGLKKIKLCSTGLNEIPTDINGGLSLVENFDESFAFTSLVEIPSGIFDYCTNVTSFKLTFFCCFSLQTLPSDLFKNCVNVTDFSLTFQNCLVNIPSGLFDNCINVTSFFGTFGFCYNVLTIPSGLFNNNTNVIDFNYTFQDCFNLTNIPSGLFSNNVLAKSFENTFDTCQNIVDYAPELWNIIDSKGTYCFRNCYNLLNYDSVPYNWK